jgi:tetratricopeptide (TPR) repeat protein
VVGAGAVLADATHRWCRRGVVGNTCLHKQVAALGWNSPVPVLSMAFAIGLAALACDPLHAQSASEADRINANLAACVDHTLSPPKRIASCTSAIDRGNLDKVATAKVYVGRGVALSAADKGDEAIADFTHAISLDPKNLNAYENRASLSLAAGHFGQAIADMTVVIHEQPANGLAFYYRGLAYERSGNSADALNDYRSSMRLLPAFAPTAAALGRLLKDADPTAALAELSAAVQLDPNSPALRSRATLYLSLGRFEDARHDYDKVIENDASDDIAYANRGVANEKLGDLNSAVRDYSRSIELKATTATYVNRGNVYEQLKQPQQALADFNAALDSDPKNFPALVGKAGAEYVLNLRVASLDDYTRVIDANPKDAIAYLKRGNLHLDLREFAAALSDYSNAVRLDPEQASALYNKSIAEGRLGRHADALTDRRKALSLDPSIAGGEEHSQ